MPADAPVEVAVVVVNFRTAEMTTECVASVIANADEVASLRVVVVDNGSGDGSADRIAAAIDANGWSERVRLVALDENVGFGRGVNRGWDAARPGRYLLALNSDALLLPGALARGVAALDGDEGIGAFSCLVVDPDGSVQNVARKLPTPLRATLKVLGLPFRFPDLFGWADTEDPGWDRRHEARDVEWLGGAFLFLRASLVERIGLFDEDFFFFGEDVELCHRVRRAGFRCRYDPGARVTHAGGGSPDVPQSVADWRTLQMYRGRYLVQRKCYGRGAETLLRAVDRMVFAWRFAVRRLRLGAEHPETRAALRRFTVLREA